ncbi:MAG: hypothetical protein H7Y17_10530, partial [Chlorobia bacterium]|nr:hypothetical protein [Fimbriimonadaceae bacterium]
MGACSLANGQTIDVEVGQTRSVGDAMSLADQAVWKLNASLAKLSWSQRQTLIRAGRYRLQDPITFPTTVWLTANGQRLAAPTRSRGRASAPLTLVFDTSGPLSYDVAYRNFLQQVFTTT